MKIKKVTEEAIVFDNGTVIAYDHCRDCCEDNYADFKQIEPEALDYDFETELKFEAVEEYEEDWEWWLKEIHNE